MVKVVEDMLLNPLARAPVTEEALEQVKELIISGKVPIGEKLPPEYQLVSMLGISRSTVREVLITLQAEGYIEIRRGKGAFVIDKASFDRMKFFEWFKSNEFKIHELLEVRMAIEPTAASLAAERMTEEELQKLEQIHLQLIGSIHDKKLGDIVRGDESFHELILKSSRNDLLFFMYSNLVPAMREYRSRAFSPPANPFLASEAHQRIYHALKQRNPNGAFEAMLFHINETRSDILRTARAFQSR